MCLLYSVVLPPMCGCCWDILLWWSFTLWRASSPGSWSSPSQFSRWTHELWASFSCCLLRMCLSLLAHRGRYMWHVVFIGLWRVPNAPFSLIFFTFRIKAMRPERYCVATTLPTGTTTSTRLMGLMCLLPVSFYTYNVCVSLCDIKTCYHPWLLSQTSSL